MLPECLGSVSLGEQYRPTMLAKGFSGPLDTRQEPAILLRRSNLDHRGRPYESIRHPLIPVTRRLLTGTPAAVWFIHLNHTNVELDRGTDIVQEGMAFDL